MTDKKKVDVTIDGRNFTVVGSESEDYIKKIAQYVDNTIKNVFHNNMRLSNHMAAILAAFNIADEYCKVNQKLKSLEKEVVGPIGNYENVSKELENSRAKIKELEEQLNNNKEEFDKAKEDQERENKNSKKYEKLLELKERELKEKEDMIKELQNKLYENQMELVQVKKELDESIKYFDSEKGIFSKEEI
ncbi:cell division protein ZapA [Sporanaerobacter sp. PP17-6a]|jgi:cell division protein ZapA|uniref:cell division protein ZapA n=1 Tax=Sporanaerobacter sp. PP17-6a TaxID=1891289 RepID=UPI0008A03AD0|nr:cell division protein ZapA [Sporanaerobacter sp. PP17-6a]SCL94934.1 Z ring-associated protein ZapA [Sporanaerobacter sp. PP17-6a]